MLKHELVDVMSKGLDVAVNNVLTKNLNELLVFSLILLSEEGLFVVRLDTFE